MARWPNKMSHEDLYPCPCCGHLVFSEPPGSYDICSICFWEDDLSQLRFPRTTGANHVSLIDGQKNYRELGACEERLRPHVRKPKGNEAVEPGWRPINLEIDDVEDPIPGTDYFALQPGRRLIDLRADEIETPISENDYGDIYPPDGIQLYYWRNTYWRRKAEP